MKTLKTKKVNIVICWNGLRNMPPKAFPSIGEMEKTAGILALFKATAPEFVEILLEGEELNTEMQTGKLQPEEMMKRKTDFSEKSNLMEIEKGNEEISIDFEDDVFNTFFQQFERWGKDWFTKIEPLLAFRKDLATTNGQPKSGK